MATPDLECEKLMVFSLNCKKERKEIVLSRKKTLIGEMFVNVCVRVSVCVCECVRVCKCV